MTWREFRRELERRYWVSLLRRLPVARAAVHGGTNRTHIYKRLRTLDICVAKLPPLQEVSALPAEDMAQTWMEVFRKHERRYWLELLSGRRCITEAVGIAGLNRSTMYERFERCGIDTQELRLLMGRKRYGGNEAWRSLTVQPDTLGRPNTGDANHG